MRIVSLLLTVSLGITTACYGYGPDSLRPQATANKPRPEEVKAVGRDIGRLTIQNQKQWKERIKLSNILMKIAMKNEQTKVNLLHFIDVLPTLSNKAIVYHLGQYLPSSNEEFPNKLRMLTWLGSFFGRIPALGPWVVGGITRKVVKRIAKNFVAGSTPEEVLEVVKALAEQGFSSTINNMGEKVLSKEEARAYLEIYLKLLDVLGEGDNISIKPSALYSETSVVDPEGTKDAIKKELYKALRKARTKGVAVNTDMEHYEFKDITLDIFKDLLKGRGEEKEFEGFDDFGTVIQAYLKDSEKDLKKIIELAEKKDREPFIRLVKGCLWEYEKSMAKHRGWKVPVFERKSQTERNFNKLALMLLEHRKKRLEQGQKAIRPAFGTHNIMSIAYVISYAQRLGLSKDDYEFQFLYGMGDAIALALLNAGYKVRIYTPEGKLIPGMAYLVRRILENTSADSFLRQLFLEAAELEELLITPEEMAEKEEKLLEHQQRQALRRKATELETETRKVLDVVGKEFARGGINPGAISVINDYANKLLYLQDKAAKGVISTPVEENRYFYIPRGGGLMIIDKDVSREDFIKIVAAPLMAGNKVTLSADPKYKPEVELLTRIFGQAGKKGLLEFREFQGEANIYMAASPRHNWVFYKGSKEREDQVRKIAGETSKHQTSVKRVITRVEPDYLKNFILPRSVTINLMRRGFAPEAEVTRPEGRAFRNIPRPDFSKARTHKLMDKALKEVRSESARELRNNHIYPLIIDGDEVVPESENILGSVNPNTEEAIGNVYMAGTEEAKLAVKAAKNAFAKWKESSVKERARYLRKAARIMTRRRFELAAWMMLEVGKVRTEALGDVDEAIDSLNYYADEIKHLAAEDAEWLGFEQGWRRKPRGVCAIIAPWNFPLAILAAMVSAAVVTGNTVVMKPAEQSPITAAKFMEILKEAGLPDGVVNYLPGRGEVVGDYLVRHPDVGLVDFTGSEAVGLEINRISSAIAREIPRTVIAEMGGKNAIIVDESADLDEAESGVVDSFIGYSNQKCSACSRVIIHQGVYDEFVRRLIGRLESIAMGDPTDKATTYGPLIDEEARQKVLAAIQSGKRYIKAQKAEGRERMSLLLDKSRDVPDKGFYVGPVVFGNVAPDIEIAQEEIFGPVLCVMKAGSFQQALDIAKSTRFGLTGAVYTRTPSHIEEAIKKFMVGNLYFNRPCTAAVVGQQPFGGFFHSGIGSKAFGPDYLQQFTRWEQTPPERNLIGPAEELGRTIKAASGGGDPNPSLPLTGLQLLSKAMAEYSPLLWLDFLKARRRLVSKETAQVIETRARAKSNLITLETAHPIPEPKATYSLSGLIKIIEAYYKRRDKLNVLEQMELYFIDRIKLERIRFFRGAQRGRSGIQEAVFKKAFDFAFKGIKPSKIRVILTNKGKIIYFAEGSPYVIKVDIGGSYFRVRDTSLKLSYRRDSVQRYLQPGDDIEYKGPYLGKDFRRIRLNARSEGTERPRLLLDEEYYRMTHFKICGDTPFPMDYFSGKDTLTLLQTADILRFRLDIKNIQFCYSIDLHKRGLVNQDEWFIEILRENKAAMFYPGKKWFSFIQHLYRLRKIVPGLESGQVKPAGLSGHRVEQYNLSVAISTQA